MEFRRYLNLIRHWAWVIILGLVIGAASGFLFSYYQVPVYQASTRILVVRAPQTNANIANVTYLTDQQLTETYLQLLTTQPVIDATSEKLGYPVDKDQINGNVITNSQIIRVSVEDTNPQRAADIANVLVDVLISQNDQIQAGRYSSVEDSLQAQIKQVQDQILTSQINIDTYYTKLLSDNETQIAALNDEITGLQQEIDGLTTQDSAEAKDEIKAKQALLDNDKSKVVALEKTHATLMASQSSSTPVKDDAQLTQLRTNLSSQQQTYLTLINNLEATQLALLQNTPNIVKIEPATIPIAPVRPNKLLNTILAGMLGLMLSAGVVFLIDYFDDTLKTPEDIEEKLGLTVIGYIAEMGNPENYSKEVFVSKQPRSPVSEAFRYLRTNLDFASVDKPLKTILITSTEPGEGKSTIAANLATIITQAGKKVLLLDADLRRPRVHRLLNISNRAGLSDLFREQNTDVNEISQPMKDIEGLTALTSGSLPPNPAELLASERMGKIINEAKKSFDVIIIDTPPTMVADAQVLAAKVDGILIIVRPGHTHTDETIATIEQLKRGGTRVLGVVLNRIPRNRDYYYGRYRSRSPYYYDGYHYYSEGDKKGKRHTDSKPKESEGQPSLVPEDQKSSDSTKGFFSNLLDRNAKNK